MYESVYVCMHAPCFSVSAFVYDRVCVCLSVSSVCVCVHVYFEHVLFALLAHTLLAVCDGRLA